MLREDKVGGIEVERCRFQERLCTRRERRGRVVLGEDKIIIVESSRSVFPGLFRSFIVSFILLTVHSRLSVKKETGEGDESQSETKSVSLY